MNQIERQEYLINYLLEENSMLGGITVPSDSSAQKELLKTLFAPWDRRDERGGGGGLEQTKNGLAELDEPKRITEGRRPKGLKSIRREKDNQRE